MNEAVQWKNMIKALTLTIAFPLFRSHFSDEGTFKIKVAM